MNPNLNPLPFCLVILDPGADESYVLHKMPFDGKVTRVAFGVQGGFTANDTNFIKLYIYDGGTDGSGTDVIGQYLGVATSGDGNLTDLQLFEDTINDVHLDAGDYIIFKYDEGGTVAPTSITINLDLVYAYPASDT